MKHKYLARCLRVNSDSERQATKGQRSGVSGFCQFFGSKLEELPRTPSGSVDVVWGIGFNRKRLETTVGESVYNIFVEMWPKLYIYN